MTHESFASHSHADATEAWRAASGIWCSSQEDVFEDPAGALSHMFTAFHSHPTGHGPIFVRLLDVKNGYCSSPNHVSESQNEDVCNLFHIFSIQKEQQKVIESDMKWRKIKHVTPKCRWINVFLTTSSHSIFATGKTQKQSADWKHLLPGSCFATRIGWQLSSGKDLSISQSVKLPILVMF